MWEKVDVGRRGQNRGNKKVQERTMQIKVEQGRSRQDMVAQGSKKRKNEAQSRTRQSNLKQGRARMEKVDVEWT